MSIFDFCKDAVPAAEPGGLLWLTCDVSSLMGQLNDIPKDSSAWKAQVEEIFRHRIALAGSVPSTNLDLLMLAFTARQAVWMLENMDMLSLDETARKYWAAEASRALVGMQYRLEQRCGVTTDELDLDLAGGTVTKVK